MKVNRHGKATVITTEQWGEVWAEMNQPYRGCAEIAYYCAERMGAVVQLRAEDVGATHIKFRGETTKTGEPKQSRITPALRRALDAAKLPRSGFLFPSERAAGHITTRVIEKHLKRAAELCGHEGMANHSPRRSRCTHLDELGWSLAKIAKVSGHKSLAELERYIDRNTREAEAELIAMDA
jgi:integrase/recombinase XerD